MHGLRAKVHPEVLSGLLKARIGEHINDDDLLPGFPVNGISCHVDSPVNDISHTCFRARWLPRNDI